MVELYLTVNKDSDTLIIGMEDAVLCLFKLSQLEFFRDDNNNDSFFSNPEVIVLCGSRFKLELTFIDAKAAEDAAEVFVNLKMCSIDSSILSIKQYILDAK